MPGAGGGGLGSESVYKRIQLGKMKNPVLEMIAVMGYSSVNVLYANELRTKMVKMVNFMFYL